MPYIYNLMAREQVKILPLNSCLRATGTTYNWTYNIGLSDVTKFAVQSITMVNSFYNIDSTNNILVLNETYNGVTTKTTPITIPVGNYDSSQLKTYLDPQLSTACTCDVSTNITFNETTGKSVITFDISDPSLYGGTTFSTTDSTCQNLLGFKGTETVVRVGSTSIYTLTSTDHANLMGYSNVFIHQNMTHRGAINPLTSRPSSLISVVQLTGSWMNNIFWKNELPIFYDVDDFTNIGFSIRDIYGDLLNNNDMNWEITLLVV